MVLSTAQPWRTSVSSSISHCGGISAVPWEECRAQRGSSCRRKRRFKDSGVRSSVANLTGQSGHRKGQSQESTYWGGLLSTSPQKGRRPEHKRNLTSPRQSLPHVCPASAAPGTCGQGPSPYGHDLSMRKGTCKRHASATNRSGAHVV